MLLSKNNYKTKGQLVDLFFVVRVLGPLTNFEAVRCHTVQRSSIITQNVTAVSFSILTPSMNVFQLEKEKKKKTSMLIWENNPLTFKFLVTSFGIAVSLYTSFSEIGLYTFKCIFNIAAFCIFFFFLPFMYFFFVFCVF